MQSKTENAELQEQEEDDTDEGQQESGESPI